MLCCIYTCRFDNEVANGKHVLYFLVVKLVGYFICEEDRKLASYTASKKFEFEILESRFHKHNVSFLVVKTVKRKCGIR